MSKPYVLSLARAILVVSTACAVLVASSLQGKVVCYADDGRHVAVEAPHRPSAASSHHHHHDQHDEHGHGHEPEHERCTDVSVEFSASRDLTPRSAPQDIQLAAPVLLPLAFLAIANHPVAAPAADGDPPGTPAISCLRTIILLV